MRTLVLDPTPPEVVALLERRRAFGQDGYDEVWDGVYHMVPAAHSRHAKVQADLLAILRSYASAAGFVVYGPFNLGDEQNFRVPDGGVFRTDPDAVYVPTAAIVVEVLSPGDETYEKFGFYAAHGVEEILVADPRAHTVRCWQRQGDQYEEYDHCALLGVYAAELVHRIAWP